MPPLIIWALGAVGAAALASWLSRESKRINAELHGSEVAPEPVEPGSPVPLERDPETGIYRPKS